MYSEQQGLDPYLVAGLVRQESEFNPQAVSPAQAYGLTQILPSTGRALLKMSRRRFRPAMLFAPELNLRLGTMYLRAVYDQNAGQGEQTLASYNAGASRVRNWMTWAAYREPAEFSETIPFSETRSYVFAVQRNALIYRKLYTAGALAAPKPKKRAPR
jgi:soluble lytic murein transglycosylase